MIPTKTFGIKTKHKRIPYRVKRCFHRVRTWGIAGVFKNGYKNIRSIRISKSQRNGLARSSFYHLGSITIEINKFFSPSDSSKSLSSINMLTKNLKNILNVFQDSVDFWFIARDYLGTLIYFLGWWKSFIKCWFSRIPPQITADFHKNFHPHFRGSFWLYANFAVYDKFLKFILAISLNFSVQKYIIASEISPDLERCSIKIDNLKF